MPGFRIGFGVFRHWGNGPGRIPSAEVLRVILGLFLALGCPHPARCRRIVCGPIGEPEHIGSSMIGVAGEASLRDLDEAERFAAREGRGRWHAGGCRSAEIVVA